MIINNKMKKEIERETLLVVEDQSSSNSGSSKLVAMYLNWFY